MNDFTAEQIYDSAKRVRNNVWMDWKTAYSYAISDNADAASMYRREYQRSVGMPYTALPQSQISQ